MAFHEIESHEFFNGDTITIGRQNGGLHAVVMNGPYALETTILFDGVVVTEDTIELYRSVRDGRVKVGELEGQPSTYGDVGAYLETLTNG